ncbi:DUF4833 domain-containing protein [Mucilaginibacter psychrotolerans]|nr:DUF4833 domain-containing protein [Mucilaginibacter psychrotolerans]
MNKIGAKQAFVFLVLLVSLWHNATARTISTLQTDTPKVRKAADGRVYPTPPPNSKRLFYLQRSTNINALSYDINIDAGTGKPNDDDPIHVYWLRYADGNGEPSELTFVQRKFAYGVTVAKTGDDNYDIRIMSYKKFPLTLMKGADGKYHIFATVAQKQASLQSIFIQIDGGSVFSPNVTYIEIKGVDPVTGKEVTERFKP